MELTEKTQSTYHKILKTQNYIAGEWLNGASGQSLKVYEKYHQDLIAEIPLASEAQMEKAIQASLEGFHLIRKWSAGKRAEHLEKLKNELIKEQNAFIDLIVAEAGKPIDYARVEVARAISTLEAAIRETYLFGGEIVNMDFSIGEGKTALTKRFPVGPIACITPFNFPLNLALHKIAPALAVGCSFVLKPPPQAPLTALAFAGLCEKAGYPAGVVNILACDIPVAEKMVKDERIKMLSFTGSAKVGWHLKNIAGKKKVTLELGGNAAVIVDESVDFSPILPLIAKGAYLYAGQICISTQRIFVQESIYEEFEKGLVYEIQKLAISNPAETGCVVSPLIDAGNLHRIEQWVSEALNKGAKLLSGGKIESIDNNLYAATLLSQTNNSMKVVSEEVFGPVAILEKFASFEEAIRLVNDSVYGLQAGIFTNRIDRMKTAFEELEVAGMMINNIPGFRMDNMPYGGIKDSGFGREGLRYAMEEMTELRLLVY